MSGSAAVCRPRIPCGGRSSTACRAARTGRRNRRSTRTDPETTGRPASVRNERSAAGASANRRSDRSADCGRQEVELRERRIVDHVLRGEHGHLADFFANAIRAVVAVKVSLQPLGRNIRGDAIGILASPGRFDRLASRSVPKICTSKCRSNCSMHSCSRMARLKASSPVAQPGTQARKRVVTGTLAEQAREMPCWANASQASGSRKKLVTLINSSLNRMSISCGILLQIADVDVRILDLMDVHPPFDAAADAWSVCKRRSRGRRGSAAARRFSASARRESAVRGGGTALQVRPPAHSGELGGHGRGRQHVVGQARGDGAGRHAGVFRRLRRLAPSPCPIRL